MRRAVLLALMSTAAFASACAALAFGAALGLPFKVIFGRDLAILIQIPVILALLVLVIGATLVERVARRMSVERSSAVAAAHLLIASFFFVVYACFPLSFWPAFAENRFDLGFDLRHSPRWVVASWLVHLVVVLAVTPSLTQRRARTSAKSPSQAPRIALIVLTLVTCASTIFAARRIHAHPRGYLATLAPVALDAEGPVRTQLGSLCIWREERALSTMQLGKPADCPEESPSIATKREPGTVLLFDAKRDVFFEPSKYHGSDTGYLAQLEGTGHPTLTMRDVAAPPPRMLFYCALLALFLALGLEWDRWRGGKLSPSSVAIVATFAAPLVVATIIGV